VEISEYVTRNTPRESRFRQSVSRGEPKIFTRKYTAIRFTGASGAMLPGLFSLSLWGKEIRQSGGVVRLSGSKPNLWGAIRNVGVGLDGQVGPSRTLRLSG